MNSQNNIKLESNHVYVLENVDGAIIMVKEIGNNKFAGLAEFECDTNPDSIGDIMAFHDADIKILQEEWEMEAVEFERQQLIDKIKPEAECLTIVAKYDGNALTLYPDEMQIPAMIYFRVPN